MVLPPHESATKLPKINKEISMKKKKRKISLLFSEHFGFIQIQDGGSIPEGRGVSLMTFPSPSLTPHPALPGNLPPSHDTQVKQSEHKALLPRVLRILLVPLPQGLWA